LIELMALRLEAQQAGQMAGCCPMAGKSFAAHRE